MEDLASQSKPNLNVVIVGHESCGKSTLAGHLLFKLGAVDRRLIDKYDKEASEKNKRACKFAWVSDKLPVERERGYSIEASTWRLETPKFSCTLIDAPGNRDYIRHMISATAQADAAILVVDASSGQFEAGISKDGQTREHALLCVTLGLKQMVVAVSKLDLLPAEEADKRFKQISEEATKVLKKVNFTAPVKFVPVSGWLGDNLADNADGYNWYAGPSLVEAMDEMDAPKRMNDRPLRIPVQDVYKIGGIGTIATGRVESGVLRPGMTVRFSPGGIESEVQSVEMHNETIQEALPGNNIGFHIKSVGVNELKKGMIVSDVSSDAAAECVSFTAEVWVLSHPSQIKKGYCPIVDCHTAHVPCKFERLEARLDKKRVVVEEEPDVLKNGELALVKLVPQRPMVVEAYSDYPSLGRFAIRDMKNIVAIGVVKSVEKCRP